MKVDSCVHLQTYFDLFLSYKTTRGKLNLRQHCMDYGGMPPQKTDGFQSDCQFCGYISVVLE